MPGTRVTCTDIDTGETESRLIENDYVLICDGYAVSGDGCVLLCEHGQAARWRNAVMFTADEARRLGMRLMAMADQSEMTEDE